MNVNNRNIFELYSLVQINWIDQQPYKQYLIIDLDEHGKLTGLFSHTFINFVEDGEYGECVVDNVRKVQL